MRNKTKEKHIEQKRKYLPSVRSRSSNGIHQREERRAAEERRGLLTRLALERTRHFVRHVVEQPGDKLARDVVDARRRVLAHVVRLLVRVGVPRDLLLRHQPGAHDVPALDLSEVRVRVQRVARVLEHVGLQDLPVAGQHVQLDLDRGGTVPAVQPGGAGGGPGVVEVPVVLQVVGAVVVVRRVQVLRVEVRAAARARPRRARVQPRLQLLQDLLAALDDRGDVQVVARRRRRRLGVGARVRRGLQDAHLLARHGEDLRHRQTHLLVQPLPHLDAAVRDDHRPVLEHVHKRHRLVHEALLEQRPVAHVAEPHRALHELVRLVERTVALGTLEDVRVADELRPALLRVLLRNTEVLLVVRPGDVDVPRLVQVDQTHLLGRHPGEVADALQHVLHDVLALRTPEPAVRRVRDARGLRRPPLAAEVGERVRAVALEQRLVQHRRRHVERRTAVRDQQDVRSDDLPVRVVPDLVLVVERVAPAGDQHVLAAGQLQLHRALHRGGSHGTRRREHRGAVLLPAEPAAQVPDLARHLRRREPEHVGDVALRLPHVLAGDDPRVAVVLLGDDQRVDGLRVRVVLPAHEALRLVRVLRLTHPLLDVPAHQHQRTDVAVRVVRVPRHGGLDVGVHLLHLLRAVQHLHLGRRETRQLVRLRDDQTARLVVVQAHVVLEDLGVHRRDPRVQVLPGDVLGGDEVHKPDDLLGFARVEPGDLVPRLVRDHQRGVQHPGGAQVVGEDAAPGGAHARGEQLGVVPHLRRHCLGPVPRGHRQPEVARRRQDDLLPLLRAERTPPEVVQRLLDPPHQRVPAELGVPVALRDPEQLDRGLCQRARGQRLPLLSEEQRGDVGARRDARELGAAPRQPPDEEVRRSDRARKVDREVDLALRLAEEEHVQRGARHERDPEDEAHRSRREVLDPALLDPAPRIRGTVLHPRPQRGEEQPDLGLGGAVRQLAADGGLVAALRRQDEAQLLARGGERGELLERVDGALQLGDGPRRAELDEVVAHRQHVQLLDRLQRDHDALEHLAGTEDQPVRVAVHDVGGRVLPEQTQTLVKRPRREEARRVPDLAAGRHDVAERVLERPGEQLRVRGLLLGLEHFLGDVPALEHLLGRVARERGGRGGDGRVPRAPADVPVERLLDVRAHDLAVLVPQQRVKRHDEPALAVPALRGVALRKLLLDGVHLVQVPEPLHGDHRLAVARHQREQRREEGAQAVPLLALAVPDPVDHGNGVCPREPFLVGDLRAHQAHGIGAEVVLC